MFKWYFGFLVVAMFLVSKNTDSSGTKDYPAKATPCFLQEDKGKEWVDSVFNSLTPDQRLGQLFMVAAFSKVDKDLTKETAKITALIKDQRIGGLIFMAGSPVRQAQMTNYYQSITNVPLMIAMDAEWGLSMRLDSTPNFGKQLMWGAMENNTAIYNAGAEIARECRRLGVHISFSPCVDINNNPSNPVIGDRSFGEDKIKVSEKGIAYMKGLQDNKVLACAKHFPGHGDTDEDSHKTLPTIAANAQRLDTLELYPFRQLINEGVGSVMVAHLNIPALDSSEVVASTLSKKIVTDLLQNNLGFQGLIFTDALNMKGVASYFKPGEVDVKALLAGNDVMLYSGDVAGAIVQINAAIDSNLITREALDARVKKVLACKYWLGLTKKQKLETKNLYKDINSTAAQLTRKELMANAITLASNNNNLIPFNQSLDTFRFAAVSVGATAETQFQKWLKKYAKVKTFYIDKNAEKADFQKLAVKLKDYNVVFLSVHQMTRKPDNFFGLTQNTHLLCDQLNKQSTCILTLFGNPYALRYFDNPGNAIVAYNDDSIMQQLAAQLIFGGVKANATMPVTANKYFRAGEGRRTNISRMQYPLPEELEDKKTSFSRIDSFVKKAIAERAMPGCQVYVAQNGRVIYNKSFGYYTYDYLQEVTDTSMFDIASVTKVAATTMAVMRLYEQNKIRLNDELGQYLDWVKGSDKEHIKLKELLVHEAGLKAWIPFYKATLDSVKKLNTKIYSRYSHDGYTIPVAADVFMKKSYIDTMKNLILKSQVGPKGNYLYSDLDFIFLGYVVEAVTGMKLDEYVKQNFYKPMGLYRTTFNPYIGYKLDNIVPSTYDSNFRGGVVKGFVHDPGAAMFGGVAGHAGLFSTASELGVLFQVLANKGVYGGVRYFDTSTITIFTSKANKGSRRGLGFDKAETEPGKKSPCADEASEFTFGHQGFTGTCVWVDPLYNLVYIFLSNRTVPAEDNDKINTMGVRSKIQKMVYEAIEEKKL